MQQPNDLRIWADEKAEDANQAQSYMQKPQSGLLAREFSNQILNYRSKS